MALITHINTGSSDGALGSSGVEFTQFSEGNDQLIFTAGSLIVADGQPLPTQAELISAGVLLTGSEIILDNYFLADQDANQLKEIFLMGNQDTRFVMAFDFDGPTASEPVLELWDDNNLNTITGTFLGAGTPSSSFVRGITTTNGTPGANWVPTSTKMAGSGSGNFLFLDDQNGPLASAKTLYANLAIVIPSSQTTGFSSASVFVIKWLSN